MKKYEISGNVIVEGEAEIIEAETMQEAYDKFRKMMREKFGAGTYAEITRCEEYEEVTPTPKL